MFIAAIKCDFCNTSHEIPCRKSGDVPDIPEGWATITPQIRIKGTPNASTCGENEWNKETQKFDKKITKETQEKLDTKKLFIKRRDELRKRFDKNHVCLDCIEEILTGKISKKIGFN